MSIKRIAVSASVALLATSGWSVAHAQHTCAGNLRASLVHPLPKPLTVGTDRTISDSPNPELARRFGEGLQKAGITLADNGSATLSIAVSVTAPPNNSSIKSGYYKSFEWMGGSPLATSGITPGIRSATLSISAVIADNTAVAQSWVATIDCRVQTDDPGDLAEFIGNALGRAVGKDIDQKAL